MQSEQWNKGGQYLQQEKLLHLKLIIWTEMHLDFEDYTEKQIIFWFGCNCNRISFLHSNNVGYWSIFWITLYTSVQYNTFDMYIKYSYQLKNTCTIAFHISTNNSEGLRFCCFNMMVHQINKTNRQKSANMTLNNKKDE